MHGHKDKQLIPSEEQKVSPDNIPRVQRLQSHTSILPYLPKHLFFSIRLFKVYIFDIGLPLPSLPMIREREKSLKTQEQNVINPGFSSRNPKS